MNTYNQITRLSDDGDEQLVGSVDSQKFFDKNLNNSDRARGGTGVIRLSTEEKNL